MDIDLLRTFVAICESGSFTAASREVGRTQSAVSLQVRRLEESLGRPLFVRSAGGLKLTEHGDLLLGHARGILSSVGDALAAFDRGSVEGVVVLGMPEDYAPRLLPRVLRGFAELYPGATVNVVLDESRVLVRRLAERSVDLAFVTDGEGPVRGGPVVFEDEMVWAAPETGDIHKLNPLPIAVWDESDTYSRMMTAMLRETGRGYRIAAVSRSITGLRMAVSSGLAVTAIAGSSVVPGMRALGAQDGFPALRRLSVRLERAHLKRSAVIDRLEAYLVALFAGPALAPPSAAPHGPEASPAAIVTP